MSDSTKTGLTAAEFFALPETNLPVQLLHGVVIELTVPELEHQDVVGNLFVLLRQAAKQVQGKANVAPVDVVLDEHNVVQPDVFLLLAGSRCLPEGNKRLIGPPDLIVEVRDRLVEV